MLDGLSRLEASLKQAQEELGQGAQLHGAGLWLLRPSWLREASRFVGVTGAYTHLVVLRVAAMVGHKKKLKKPKAAAAAEPENGLRAALGRVSEAYRTLLQGLKGALVRLAEGAKGDTGTGAALLDPKDMLTFVAEPEFEKRRADASKRLKESHVLSLERLLEVLDHKLEALGHK
jgi:hypothetical protein